MQKLFFLSVRFARVWFVLAVCLIWPRLGSAQGAGSNLVINIVSPTNGEIFVPLSGLQPDIYLMAKASDAAGDITNVQFFSKSNLIGTASEVVLDPPGVNGVTGLVWFFEWFGVPDGSYTLTATATDDQGASATSPAVNITVEKGAAVTVRITSPANNSDFRSPIDIPITAFAQGTHGQFGLQSNDLVTNVEFFAGANDLGAGHHLMGHGFLPSNYFPLPYRFGLVWSNPPPGSYPLTAVATDTKGASATSAVINITILPAPTPSTNLPDIVSIVAADPIAVAGTNFWFWLGPLNPFPTWTNWPPTNGEMFTNYGPKDALFTVFRYGDAASNLDVTYTIGGTATNGVDYATLSGKVTIPAGACSTLITIAPMDTNPPAVQTVILTLNPSTNNPPDGLVGFPAQAEALILAQWVRPLPFLLPDGNFNLNEPGPDGAWFRADWSSDLLDWSPLCTNQVVQGSIDVVDPGVANNAARYYRVVPLDGPP